MSQNKSEISQEEGEPSQEGKNLGEESDRVLNKPFRLLEGPLSQKAANDDFIFDSEKNPINIHDIQTLNDDFITACRVSGLSAEITVQRMKNTFVKSFQKELERKNSKDQALRDQLDELEKKERNND